MLFKMLSAAFFMRMFTRIVVILALGLYWVKLLLGIRNWYMQLLREFIRPQERIDTTAKTDGSGDDDLDYQNDHIDLGDLYINDLDDLGSQDDQNDSGDLGGLEDLDYQDDQSDEDDASDHYDQGYLADVDDQDDIDDFVNSGFNRSRFNALLLIRPVSISVNQESSSYAK
ncbi:hypothetical protein V5799_013042, partial [Amblyomma americanum]